MATSTPHDYILQEDVSIDNFMAHSDVLGLGLGYNGSSDPSSCDTCTGCKTRRKFRQHSIIVTVGTHSLSVKEQNE